MHRGLGIAIGILALTIAVYWQTATFGFVIYDDPPYVTENPRVRAGLSVAGVRWAFTHADVGNWQPLTTLSHMLACELFGLDASGHHLFNVGLHAAAALALFAWLNAATGAAWPSAFVAALFAVHPLHVESVAWVSSRKDPLAALWGFFALWAYVAWAGAAAQDGRAPGRRAGPAMYWLALAGFALSLMAKPMLVTMPFLLLLLDYWPLGRLGPQGAALAAAARERHITGGVDRRSGGGDTHGPKARRERASASRAVAVRATRPSGDPARGAVGVVAPPLGWLFVEKLPFLFLSIVSSVVTVAAQRGEGAMALGTTIPVDVRLANALVSYVRYLGKLVWPHDLAVLYPHPALPGGTPLAVWQIGAACVVLVTITAAVIVARRQRFLAVAWFWFLGALVPVIGLVQVGEQAMADRYAYVPLIGLYIAIGWGIVGVVAPLRGAHPALPRVAAMAALVVVLAAAAGAWRQTRVWRDSTSLFRHALAVAPEPPVMHNNLAIELQRAGRIDEAVHHYREALRVQPDYATALANLGILAHERGDLATAADYYRRALAADPHYVSAHTNLGAILRADGDFDGAIAHFRQALAADPEFVRAHIEMGATLGATGNIDAAMRHLERAAVLAPDYAPAHIALAEALHGNGSPERAIDHYRRAVALRPGDSPAHAPLAVLLHGSGEIDAALEHYRTALRIDPTRVDLRNNLGHALYTRGAHAEAIAEYERALAAEPENAQVHNNLGNALLGGNDVEGAIRHYRRATAARPDYAHAHNNLGFALSLRGELAAAIEEYREAVRLDPAYTQAADNLARAEAARSGR